MAAATKATQPTFSVEVFAGEAGATGVIVSLDAHWMVSLAGRAQEEGLLQALFRISVVATEDNCGDDLPGCFGRYGLLETGIRFIPHFPFEPGLTYRATFDPRPMGRWQSGETLTFEFSLPKLQTASINRVKQIFPSSEELPENLLRFYVQFENSMERGHAEAEITILEADNNPACDVLYRAPVELWDRSMRCLTVLLDPGRLKRGLGPNRALGPPLIIGGVYTLVIGAGMVDAYGARLPQAVYKRFRVTEAIRERVAVEQWKLMAPATLTREPLVLCFPRPLDHALLCNTLTIASAEGKPVTGNLVVDELERRWSFTPLTPWGGGFYQVQISSSLEDVCGNNLSGAFDRPLRPDCDPAGTPERQTLSFHLW